MRISVHYCQCLPFLNLYLFAVAADENDDEDDGVSAAAVAAVVADVRYFFSISVHFTSLSNR